jgi:nitrogen fixation protein FixH
MSNFDIEIDTRQVNQRRRLTGWRVLLYLVGFFGVIMGVNGVLIYEALSTLSGVDTDSAYQAGRMYERDVAMAKAQDGRHWRVDAKVTPSPDGARLDVVALDAAGRPLGGLQASAVFERPPDRRLDRDVALAEDSAGRFHGGGAIAAGQWDLVIELSRQGEQLFRSKNRVILK